MSFNTEKLITEIQNRPCLWDSASTDYSNRILKSKCWDEIATIFKDKEEITKSERRQLVGTLQRKWKSIRGCFTRELNRQKSLRCGSQGPRKSEYVFYKNLQFLQNVVTIRDPDPDGNTTEDSEGSKEEHQENGPKRMKKEDISEEEHFVEIFNVENRDALEASNSTSSNHLANDDDDDRLFMLSLVNTLKKVPPEIKMATKINIMSILDEATRSHYARH